MIKIKDLKNGFVLNYDENCYEFKIVDLTNKTITKNSDQRTTEDKFETWLKQESKKGFPIECLKIETQGWGGEYATKIINCKITSYDPEEKELWFSDGTNRGKDSISRGTNYFEITENNKVSINTLEQIQMKLKTLKKERDSLLVNLEKPITPKFFEERKQ